MSELEQRDRRLGSVLLNQYRVDTMLGQGGMGTVYGGTQLSVNRPVAIKLIAGPVAQNPEAVRRFRREAEAMAKLRHPNTVRLFEFGVTEDEQLFMVMELLEGSDLAEQIQRSGALPVKQALTVARQTLESLCEAHALGIVHRDLKPANVFLAKIHGGQTVAKVMDFGIAGIEQTSGSTKLTLQGAVIGSPAYMSPEQAMGREVDARSDLYSLGVTLFEMLVGRAPFEAESAAPLLLAQVSTPPPKLAEARPDVAWSPSLQALLDRLLAKEPERRFDSAQAALDAVEALLRSESAGSLGGFAQQTGVARTDRGVTAPSFARSWRVRLLAASAAVIPIGLVAWAVWPKAEPHAIGPVAAAPVRPPSAAVPATGAPSAKVAPVAPLAGLHRVQIVSSPTGASVELQGVDIGKTPFDFQFRQRTELTIRLAGYHPAKLRVSPDSEPNLVVDLVRFAQPSQPTPAAPKRQLGGEVVAASVEPPPSVRPPPSASPASRASPPPSAPPAPSALKPPPLIQPAPVKLPPIAAGPRVAAANLQTMPSRERRLHMLATGSVPYRNVAAAKRAYREKRVDERMYEDVIWTLKSQRKQRIVAEKLNYKQGRISRAEYDRRVERIDRDYEGP